MKLEDIKIGNIIRFSWQDAKEEHLWFWNKIEGVDWITEEYCIINTKIIKQLGSMIASGMYYGHNEDCYMLCMYEKKFLKGDRFYAERHMTQNPNKYASCFGTSDIKCLKEHSASGPHTTVNILDKAEQFILCL